MQVQATEKGKARVWIDYIRFAETPPEGALAVGPSGELAKQDWIVDIRKGQWEQHPDWLGNPARDTNVSVDAEGVHFSVGTAFLGMKWALALYIIDLAIVFLLGRVAFKILPGEPTALIMEMPEYRIPHLKTVIKQTWFRLEEFIKISFPLIIVSGVLIKLAEVSGFLEPLSHALSPVTVSWLGLPEITGVTLIFGILRKELTLVMLATLLGTTDFQIALTPLQMFVFTLVTMLYVPCIATIAACIKEFGWKKALAIAIIEILFAVFVGGLAYRILAVLNLP